MYLDDIKIYLCKNTVSKCFKMATIGCARPNVAIDSMLEKCWMEKVFVNITKDLMKSIQFKQVP